MGFSQGVSGLNAAASNLDTIGNNIANSQTVGYKASRSEFADMFAGSMKGLGVKESAITQSFTDGSLKTTNRDLDVAIDGGGFFRLTNGSQILYSRNGQFQQTKDGNIVNAQGARLTGYNVTNFNNPAANPSIDNGGNPETIQIPTESLNAKPTSEAFLEARLDSGANTITDTFDPDDNDTFNWSTPFSTFDSLGNSHSLNMYFTKTGTGTWEAHGRMKVPETTPAQFVGFDGLELQFDSNGNLTNIDDAGVTAIGAGSATKQNNNTAELTLDLANGADPIDFNLSFKGTTNMAQNFGSSNPRQDGYAPGDLTGIKIEDDGTITGNYSNGQRIGLAQIALASFRNEQGLNAVGDNAWVETQSSGQPALGVPGSGLLGDLKSGTLEESNVDMAQQLVEMIIAQRAYQANSQTIKTQDQIMQTAVNLR